jgi:hypothetical protein
VRLCGADFALLGADANFLLGAFFLWPLVSGWVGKRSLLLLPASFLAAAFPQEF